MALTVAFAFVSLRHPKEDALTRTLKIIRHTEVEDWLRLGWCIVDLLPGPHGHWSCLGEWLCDCRVATLK